MPDTTNLNLLWTSLLIEELIRQGCNYFCISPGSRSAPLTVAAARTPGAYLQLCYDERAAAFHALGWARATGRPAVLICTSGSALAHYLPAVVEASQDRVPMLILSADRPPELIEAGANQAIRQPGIYGDYVRWAFDFPCPDIGIPAAWVLSTLDQALHRCFEPDPGPVHLNLPFREPLAPSPEPILADYLAGLPASGAQPRVIHALLADRELHPAESAWLEDLLSQAGRGLLILGRLKAHQQDAALQIANRLGWPVFADILSGLRLDSRLETQIQSYDQLLANPNFAAACEFDTVLHLGGAYVSGRLLKHLAAHQPRTYLQFEASDTRQDPNHQVTYRSQSGLDSLAQILPPAAETPWLAKLQAFGDAANQVYADILDSSEALSEPGVARLLSRLLPVGHALMLGNSMAVREADGFGAACRPELRVFGNRGTSGIDGHLATAAGYANGSACPVTLLCGDLTLFHDLNSLYLLKTIPIPVTLVVINNAGGGIFSFLPIAGHTDVFEPWFGTPHDLSFAGAAAMFGLEYHQPTTRAELRTALEASWNQARPALIEVRTVRAETLALHRLLQEKVSERL